MGTQEHIMPIVSYTGNQSASGYFGFNGQREFTESPAQLPFSKGQIKELHVNIGMSATSCTIMLRKNGADTGITGVVLNAAQGHVVFSGPLDIVDGDLLCLYITKLGAGSSIWIIYNAEVLYGNA